ncbi:hypothetical protein [Aliivibrio sp. S10_S31]|uniref:hypothetical protein n=1 Tax=Aliivibrio sp. S10_S31 TaxID=2720224 RepID=UPI0016810AF1|nr:hypothetical protein [Aliivibrio sp. S10_S31]MBD1567975.1 hypothetical protein [Aliivibrio sp. S10_S31]
MLDDKKHTKSSGLSDFVRNSSSRDKKKIYGTAIKDAIASQQKVIEKSRSAA